MTETIHIVCLDAPSPPDYGGAIDMFYKIKALAEAGKKIILHYFAYNPSRGANGLEAYCHLIYTYSRKNSLHSLPLSQPYIVQSRINKNLINRLNEDEHPILLEGLHCAGLLSFLKKKERVILRMHNEEAAYYQALANAEKSFLKKKYFNQESKLIHRYQKAMEKNILLAPLSETDIRTFAEEYKFQHVHFIPCFIPWQQVASVEGKGEYCLYHGNLSVSENEEAVAWLIKNIFSQLAIPFVVAGKGLSKKIVDLAMRFPHIKFINHPPMDEMDALIRDAHIHVLPSMNRTGVKIKLLNALLNGRYCIINEKGIRGTGIATGVIISNDAAEWKASITALMQKEFTTNEIEERKGLLSLYNNAANAQQLNALWKRYQ